MKLTINKGVRDTIRGELLAACDALDQAIRENDGSLDVRIQQDAARRAVATAACRILSHATRGKRYPLMTLEVYDTP